MCNSKPYGCTDHVVTETACQVFWVHVVIVLFDPEQVPSCKRMTHCIMLHYAVTIQGNKAASANQ